MDNEKGKLQCIYEEAYEQGWSDGYDAAVHFLVTNDRAYARIKEGIYKDQIA